MVDQPTPGTLAPQDPPPPQTGGPPPAAGWTPPQGPSGPRAGFGRRLAATFIDGLIFGMVGFFLGQVFGDDVVTTSAWKFNYRLTGTPFLINDLVSLAYFVYFEGSAAGQTLGKRVMGIRVIDFGGGGSIGYGRAFVRWIGRFVSAIPLFLGYFWMLWDRQNQTWHDKFANSLVVPADAYPVGR